MEDKKQSIQDIFKPELEWSEAEKEQGQKKCDKILHLNDLVEE